MRKVNQSIYLFLIVVFLTAIALSCSKSSLQSPEKNIISFRNIPGVTEEEIKAIEELKDKKISFVYGVNPSTEAFYAKDNTIKGFAALFCEWLSGLFEIKFEPDFYGWDSLLKGLDSCEVDFTGGLTVTDERRKTYFMTDAIAVRTVKYFRLEGSRPLTEIEAMRPLRFAFFDGSTTYNHVVSSNAYKTFVPFFVRNTEEAYNLLKGGEIDAIIEESVLEAAFDIYGNVSAMNFFPLIFNPVSLATKNPSLEPIISVVQKALKNDNLRYLTMLHNKGYSEYLRNKLFMRLSEDEYAYLKTHQVVSFAAEIDNYPICFFNKQERQWQGIAFEVMNEIENLTGLTFKMANVNNQQIAWPVMVNMLEEGEVSMLTELIRTQERKDRFIWPETSIITDNYALLSKSSQHNISPSEILHVKVGLPKGTAYTELFKSWFPDHQYTVEYPSSNIAFNALDRGEVDVVMSSQYRFLLLTNYKGLPDYKANVVFDRTFNSTFGFNKKEVLLCSIIDKSLELIDIKGITGQWMRKTFDYRVKLMQAKMPLMIGGSIFLAGILFMFLLFQRKHNESKRLEELVQKRTAELNESQIELETALIAAKAANSSKTTFLANMSHEIRTPMNSIIGFSELAMDGEVSPNTKDYLGKIIENSNGLLQIINDILDISKVEAGQMILEKIPFDMHELFSSCRNLIMPKAIEKGLVVHFYAEPSLGKKPLGDPTRLRQVILNLLSNAVKFTNTGTVKLHAKIVDKTEKNITIHFDVKDSGIGMSSEEIKKIFAPFAQAESGITRKYGGTGLGLSIAKNIVELMGGRLSVDSVPGVGSKFSFELTFDTIEVIEQELFEKKLIFNIREKPTFSGEVLLCEDNIMNQEVIFEHLTRVGLKTIIAENGKKGFEIVNNRKEKGEKQFDLILMDIHMPVMDGLEAADKILKLDTGVPIVAMTANIMSSDREIYKKIGMKDCVGKPFTAQELWYCLMKYLKPISWQSMDGTSNNQSDYKLRYKLISTFVKENTNRLNEIISAINTGDIKLANRLAHTLKGNAGQLGKTLLQQAAASLEECLANEKSMVTEEHLKDLETELNAVLIQFVAELKAMSVMQAVQQEQTGQISIQTAMELIEELKPLLEMGNPDCRELVGKISLIPGSEKLIQQIENLDFEQAAVTLVELKRSFKDE